jgi:membrane fusion protein (multidrug efflux system)
VTISVDALASIDLTGHVESIWRRAPAPNSRCCRRRTRPAISPRSSSACRCAIAIDAGPDARRILVPGLSVTVSVDTISAKGEQRRIIDQEKARSEARRMNDGATSASQPPVERARRRRLAGGRRRHARAR